MTKNNIPPSSNWFNLSSPSYPKEYLELEQLLAEIDLYLDKLRVDGQLAVGRALKNANQLQQNIEVILTESEPLRGEVLNQMDIIATTISIEALKKQSITRKPTRIVKKSHYQRQERDDWGNLISPEDIAAKEDERLELMESYDRGGDSDELRIDELLWKLAEAKLHHRPSKTELENALESLLLKGYTLRVDKALEEVSKPISDSDYWYTEDNIADLLRQLLPDEQHYHIIAQTQLENLDLLQANLNQAIGNVIGNDHVAVMPVHLHGNHWIGIMIHQQADGDVQVIIINPTGAGIGDEANAPLLIQIINQAVAALSPGSIANIIDLTLRQQYNGNDCGPLTVDNLVRLAEAADLLDNLNREEIINSAHLQWLGYVGAGAMIRAAHDRLLPEDTLQEEWQSSDGRESSLAGSGAEFAQDELFPGGINGEFPQTGIALLCAGLLMSGQLTDHA